MSGAGEPRRPSSGSRATLAGRVGAGQGAGVAGLVAWFVLGALGAPSLHAKLEWQTKSVERSARSTDVSVEAVYRFTNKGETPVLIREIETSCGCTAASPPREPIAPGATGEITARFTVGDRIGPQRSTLRVLTDAADDPAALLEFAVNIEEQFTVDPRFAYWMRDAPVEPKVVTIRIKPGAELTLKNLEAPAGDFSANVIEDEPGKVWRIQISPTSTAGRTTTVFAIEMTGPGGVSKSYKIIARVL